MNGHVAEWRAYRRELVADGLPAQAQIELSRFALDVAHPNCRGRSVAALHALLISLRTGHPLPKYVRDLIASGLAEYLGDAPGGRSLEACLGLAGTRGRRERGAYRRWTTERAAFRAIHRLVAEHGFSAAAAVELGRARSVLRTGSGGPDAKRLENLYTPWRRWFDEVGELDVYSASGGCPLSLEVLRVEVRLRFLESFAECLVPDRVADRLAQRVRRERTSLDRARTSRENARYRGMPREGNPG